MAGYLCPECLTGDPKVHPEWCSREAEPVCNHGARLTLTCYKCRAEAHENRAKARGEAKLPTDPQARKGLPIVTGVLDYFPDAIVAVAALSKWGNDKHNPGEPLGWSRDKSTDHADCIGRHLLERGTIDKESGFSHTVALAWRALALLQIEIEADRDKLLAPK